MTRSLAKLTYATLYTALHDIFRAVAVAKLMYASNDTIRYDTIRDAILTCARKPT